MNIDHEQRTAPREFNLAPDQHHTDYLRSLLQELAESDGLTVRPIIARKAAPVNDLHHNGR